MEGIYIDEAIEEILNCAICRDLIEGDVYEVAGEIVCRECYEEAKEEKV